MTVILAERKGVEPPNIRDGRTAFAEVLKSCTVLMLTCPLTRATISMIDEPELRLMRHDAILINVARGGIVVEEALVEALRKNWIAGAGTDVFVQEPAHVGNSALVRESRDVTNLVMSPHVAWYARSSIEKLRRTVQDNIQAWYEGKQLNLVP